MAQALESFTCLGIDGETFKDRETFKGHVLAAHGSVNWRMWLK